MNRQQCRKVKAMEALTPSVDITQSKNEYIRQLDGLGYSCDGTNAVTK